MSRTRLARAGQDGRGWPPRRLRDARPSRRPAAREDPRRRRLPRILGLALLAVLAPTSARADKAACAVAADEASVLRRDVSRLTRARALLRVCAADRCDADIREDCRRWLHEVDESLPTVVFAAEDDEGRPVVPARVLIDGVAIAHSDGRPVAVDPGEHTFTFERHGWPPVEVRALARLGRKNAEVLARFPKSARSPAPSVEPASVPSGFVFGAQFVAVPYAFFKADDAPRAEGTSGVSVGLSLESGYAFSRRAEILVRALGAAGSECGSATGSNFLSLGPALSVRALDWAWVGVALLGGQARSCTSSAAKLSTNIVFSPTFDLAFAVVTQPYGQWMITASIGYYFANITNDNRVLYAPVGFGLRLF